jgi:alanine-glyoxylate transaminase/serine-glyoxylate transaminase/serine-pyruvate transaminase
MKGRHGTTDPLLLIPGPVDVHPSVLATFAQPVVPHYGAEWTAVYNATVDLVKQLFMTRHDAFLIPGSGSAGLDAGIGSLLKEGDTVLIGINGYFGGRLKEIALTHGATVVEVTAEWGSPVAVEAVEQALREHPEAKAGLFVHCETSTGVLNPIERIGPLLRQRGVTFMVDAITSAGGESFRMDDWDIDIAVSASQKCVAAPPGLAMVAVGPQGWKGMENRARKPRGWYLNLLTWRQYRDAWADWHPFPVTEPTSNVLALKAAIELALKDGLPDRISLHRRASGLFREGLAALGIELVAEGTYAAHTVTAAVSPSGAESSRLIEYLLASRNIRIADGMGKTANKWFRVGHMGGSATDPRIIEALLEGIGAFCRRR